MDPFNTNQRLFQVLYLSLCLCNHPSCSGAWNASVVEDRLLTDCSSNEDTDNLCVLEICLFYRKKKILVCLVKPRNEAP